MRNPRITKREAGLIKGALRRVFSRSELRRAVIDAAIDHSYVDLSRPKVKKWAICAECKKRFPKSYAIIDHIDPLIPIGLTFEDMSLDTIIDRLWCEQNNLQCLDEMCHAVKTKAERALRKQSKKKKG